MQFILTMSLATEWFGFKFLNSGVAITVPKLGAHKNSNTYMINDLPSRAAAVTGDDARTTAGRDIFRVVGKYPIIIDNLARRRDCNEIRHRARRFFALYIAKWDRLVSFCIL